jgi:hypothetical protein
VSDVVSPYSGRQDGLAALGDFEGPEEAVGGVPGGAVGDGRAGAVEGDRLAHGVGLARADLHVAGGRQDRVVVVRLKLHTHRGHQRIVVFDGDGCVVVGAYVAGCARERDGDATRAAGGDRKSAGCGFFDAVLGDDVARLGDRHAADFEGGAADVVDNKRAVDGLARVNATPEEAVGHNFDAGSCRAGAEGALDRSAEVAGEADLSGDRAVCARGINQRIGAAAFGRDGVLLSLHVAGCACTCEHELGACVGRLEFCQRRAPGHRGAAGVGDVEGDLIGFANKRFVEEDVARVHRDHRGVSCAGAERDGGRARIGVVALDYERGREWIGRCGGPRHVEDRVTIGLDAYGKGKSRIGEHRNGLVGDGDTCDGQHAGARVADFERFVEGAAGLRVGEVDHRRIHGDVSGAEVDDDRLANYGFLGVSVVRLDHDEATLARVATGAERGAGGCCGSEDQLHLDQRVRPKHDRLGHLERVRVGVDGPAATARVVEERGRAETNQGRGIFEADRSDLEVTAAHVFDRELQLGEVLAQRVDRLEDHFAGASAPHVAFVDDLEGIVVAACSEGRCGCSEGQEAEKTTHVRSPRSPTRRGRFW